MIKAEFAAELEKVEFGRQHAEQAFNWLRTYGRKGAHNILFYKTSPGRKVAWAALDKEGNRYFIKQAATLAYLFARNGNEGALGEEAPFEKTRKSDEIVRELAWYNHNQILAKAGIEGQRFGEPGESAYDLSGAAKDNGSSDKLDDTTQKITNRPYEHEINLLRQFRQIILHGPPGTGKTYAAKGLLPQLLGINDLEASQGERWDIVQFHPSYNYEDFVRGIKVDTDENGKVFYETVNRTFGNMCKIADDDPDNAYALIIDEINRANVSAVLGELIYALEYRGKEVRTPYTVNDNQNIVIPENLYVIGTMNTADRTIGQIDYAVRRRFAFVAYPPKAKVITDETGQEFFNRVDALFVKDDKPSEYMSPDFDATDVRIGHSYFLPKADAFGNGELSNKIVYQVIPILREYVKDGVLTTAAESVIGEIEEDAEQLSNESAGIDSPEDTSDEYAGSFPFFWEKGEDSGNFQAMGYTALNVIDHYTQHNNVPNIEDLRRAFSLHEEGKGRNFVVNMQENLNSRHYFIDEGRQITLSNGDKIAVSFQWKAPDSPRWKRFINAAEQLGYTIHHCRFVNIGEGNARNWGDCKKYGFLAAGGRKRDQTDMEKLKVGDPVFAYRGDKVSNAQRGFIAFGKVAETAVRIDKLKVDDGRLLSECESVRGGTYREKHPNAFARGELHDYATRVVWHKILEESAAVKIKWNANVVRERIDWSEFQKLLHAFNLSDGMEK